MMNAAQLIEDLEREWNTSGFLDQVRSGVYIPDKARTFLAMLKAIHIPDDAMIPKRLVSLVWYLPSFLEWQKDRVQEAGGDRRAYDGFVTEVHNVLEEVLGVP